MAVQAFALPGGVRMEMVWCPPGAFAMGSPVGEVGRRNDEVLREVTLTKGFWLGKYPVTQAQWRSVMGSSPSYLKGWDRPVERVSWDDCQVFCQKAGRAFRLPTEAEWEYACRAGSLAAYGGTGCLEEMGWSAENSGGQSHPVGRKAPNAWGFHDMHGNVWEWCRDRWSWTPEASDAAVDPSGPSVGEDRLLRGGSWRTLASECRSASRIGCSPDFCGVLFGFRLAWS